MGLIEKALAFAQRAHSGMLRKGSDLPYLMHPMEAAVIAASMTEDENVIAAALLHDVVEDTDVTIEEIRREFGDRVAWLVDSETENKRERLPRAATWMTRKKESIDFLQQCGDIGAKQLYLGDKLSNLRAISRDFARLGDALWQRFNQQDPEMHHWYYRSICNAISELAEHPVWQEFDRLIRETFGEC